MVDGKCREFLEESRRLIIEEVVCKPNAKMFVISLSARKTLARQVLDDCSDGKVELFKGE
jgi:hypothetical protein